MILPTLPTYKSLCTEYYDLDKPNAPPDALAFYLKYAERARGPILEPMCGTGRFLIPLQQVGYLVEGLDASKYMLDALRSKCATKGLSPVVYEQFLHEFLPHEQYALIFIPAGSFSLIADEQQAKNALRHVFDLLLPGGKLVFEVESFQEIPKQPGIWHGSWVERSDGTKIVASSLPFYDQEKQIIKSLCRYLDMHGDQIVREETEIYYIRLYGPGEMDRWLKAAGFQNVKKWKTYEMQASEESDFVLAYECEKSKLQR